MIRIFFLSVSYRTCQGLLYLSLGTKMKLIQRNFLGRKVYYAIHWRVFLVLIKMFLILCIFNLHGAISCRDMSQSAILLYTP